MNHRIGVSVRAASRHAPGSARALALFREAARTVPAYKDFLKKHGVRARDIRSAQDFAQVPPTDKANYISRYSLADLAWGGTLDNAHYVSSSSGSTGVPFYWPRSERHDAVTGAIFRGIYERIFGTKRGTTLFLDMFALGTWLAGLQFYDGARRVAAKGNHITIVASGIEKATAIDAIKRLAPHFDRIVMAGYPPFLKDVLEDGKAVGIEWSQYDVRLLAAGEAVSEVWRDRAIALAGRRRAHDLIVVYGMAEAGVVAHETPQSIAMRRSLRTNRSLSELLVRDGNLSPLYQYDPAIRYFEMERDDALVLTADAGIPLIRYNTRDEGGLLSHEAAVSALPARYSKEADAWPLPFVYLYGRRDLSISLYALNIYVDNIKRALERAPRPSSFSGLFTMHVGHTAALDQEFEITIELARGVSVRSVARKPLTAHIVRILSSVNAEYAKLHSTLGEKAAPQITLVKNGEIETRPGRKHSWVPARKSV